MFLFLDGLNDYEELRKLKQDFRCHCKFQTEFEIQHMQSLRTYIHKSFDLWIYKKKKIYGLGVHFVFWLWLVVCVFEWKMSTNYALTIILRVFSVFEISFKIYLFWTFALF